MIDLFAGTHSEYQTPMHRALKRRYSNLCLCAKCQGLKEGRVTYAHGGRSSAGEAGEAR